MKKPNGYWTRNSIDEAFDDFMQGRKTAPLSSEFNMRYPGVFSAISEGKYDPKIDSWGKYLEHRGFIPNRKEWPPEKIDNVFHQLVKELERTPTYHEFSKRYPGAFSAICRGRYHPDIKTWVQYLHEQGIGPHKGAVLESGEIDRIFDELRLKLGRLPITTDFKEKHSLALSRILSGQYDPKVKSWNQYLKHRGIEPVSPLTPRMVDEAFDSLMQELGCIPTNTVFRKKHSRAMNAIQKGRYSPNIKRWTQYLEYRGHKPQRRGTFTPDSIDRSFDAFKAEIGRMPTSGEFKAKHGPEYSRICKGKYHPNIKGWGQYLQHRGYKESRVATLQEFESLIRSESDARFIVERFGGDEADVADILAVVYEGRLSRDDALHFMEDPSLRKYLGGFQRPSGIGDIFDAGEHLLPYDKNNVIRDIIYRKALEYRADRLGTTPTAEQRQRLLQELEAEIGAL